MSIAQPESLNRGFFSLVGPIHKCFVAHRDEDLFILLSDNRQQDALLKLDQTQVADRQISRLKDEIKKALEDQNVIEVDRVTRTDGRTSDTVFLTFASRLPPSVKMAGVNFPVNPTSQILPNVIRLVEHGIEIVPVLTIRPIR